MKDKYKIYHFLAGPEMNADTKSNAELTKAVPDEWKDFSQALGSWKEHSHYRYGEPSHTRYFEDTCYV